MNSTADRPDADVGTPACSDTHRLCTLRGAIMQANFHPGPDIIKVPAGIFTLTRAGRDDGGILGDLDVTDSVTISGAGSSRTIVDGNGIHTHDRVIQILPTAANVTISGLTIRNGRRTVDTFDSGGGLSWQGGGNGHLVLRSLVIAGNAARYDGGLDLQAGLDDSVDLNGITVRNNTSTAAAGGIAADLSEGSSFTLRNSRVYGNTAYEGGGLYISVGSVTSFDPTIAIRNSAISGNHATGLSGGIENHAGTAAHPVLLAASDIHDNVADVYGGGIGNYGVLDVSGSTVASNRAGAKGGGVYGYAGSETHFTNTTLSGNSATADGGGLYLEVFTTNYATMTATSVTMGRNSAATAGGVFVSPGASFTATDTLIAKGTSGANCNSIVGGLWNLSDDSSCGFGAGDGIADLKLGPLADHGGPTRTLLPGPGSPALDAGSGGPAADQRGIARPQGSAVDVGAVEVCQTKPSAPHLVSPTNRTVKVRRPTLDWADVPCVESYTVVIRHRSRTGPIVKIVRGLHLSSYRTATLHHGWTYYWEVRAVGDRGTTSSVWRHFHVR